jgi:hypothetical protein
MKTFSRVGDDLVGKNNDRDPEPFGQVEGPDGVIEHLLGRGRAEGDEE